MIDLLDALRKSEAQHEARGNTVTADLLGRAIAEIERLREAAWATAQAERGDAL